MTKTQTITSGKMDSTGWKKMGKSLILTIGAALIGWILDLTTNFNFGNWHSIVAVCLPLIANFLKKWLGNYEASK